MAFIAAFELLLNSPFYDFLNQLGPLSNLISIYSGLGGVGLGTLIYRQIVRKVLKDKDGLIEELRNQRNRLEEEVKNQEEEIKTLTRLLPNAALELAQKELSDHNPDLAHRAVVDWMDHHGQTIAQILLMRAKWTLARAAGEIRENGVVASNAYCIAASTFSNSLTEAILLRKETEAMLRHLGAPPPLAESLRTFDAQASQLFAGLYDADQLAAADVLLDEGIRRYRHTNYRAALLVLALAEAWIQSNEGRLSARMLQLLYWKSGALDGLGLYHQALDATDEAINGYRKNLALDPANEWLRNNSLDRARILNRLGRYEEALKEARDVVEVRTKNKDLGAEHPDTLTSRDLVARILNRLGR